MLSTQSLLDLLVHLARICALEGCRGGALGWRVIPSASRPEMVGWVPSSPPPPEPESLFSGDFCPDRVERFRIWEILSIGASLSSISMAASTGLPASEGEDALLLVARFVLDVEIGLG